VDQKAWGDGKRGGGRGVPKGQSRKCRQKLAAMKRQYIRTKRQNHTGRDQGRPMPDVWESNYKKQGFMEKKIFLVGGRHQIPDMESQKPGNRA